MKMMNDFFFFERMFEVQALPNFFFQVINYNIKRTKIECIDTDPILCGNPKCELKIVGRGKEVVNVGCNITRPLNDFFIHIVYNYKYGTIYRKYLIDYVFDICKVNDKESRKMNDNERKLAAAVVNSYLNSNQTQIVHPCPYFGPTYLLNYTTVELLGQTMLPEGEYRIDNRYFEGKTNKTLYMSRIYYTIKGKNPLLDMRLG